MRDIKKDPFEEYIKNLPPTQREMGEAWSAAIGLQDVDGLKPSEYLYRIAKKNIEGEITIDEVDDLINSYYETKEGRAEHGIEDDPINDPIKLADRETKIIELLRSEPGITRAKIAESLGCSESTVKRCIQAMISKNMIRRIGSNKRGEWIILE